MASFNLNYFAAWSGPLVVVSRDGCLADWTSDKPHPNITDRERHNIYDFRSLPAVEGFLSVAILAQDIVLLAQKIVVQSLLRASDVAIVGTCGAVARLAATGGCVLAFRRRAHAMQWPDCGRGAHDMHSRTVGLTCKRWIEGVGEGMYQLPPTPWLSEGTVPMRFSADTGSQTFAHLPDTSWNLLATFHRQ